MDPEVGHHLPVDPRDFGGAGQGGGNAQFLLTHRRSGEGAGDRILGDGNGSMGNQGVVAQLLDRFQDTDGGACGVQAFDFGPVVIGHGRFLEALEDCDASTDGHEAVLLERTEVFGCARPLAHR